MLDNEKTKELINTGRRFMQGHRNDDPFEEEFISDQDKKLPMPPLTKAPMAPESARIALPRDFSALDLKCDLQQLIYARKSSRVYTGKSMSLLQLSFLLWATQGIKSIRGKGYATLRTVPSGGARHEFETYLIVSNVEGLKSGAYHYLPFEHAIEYINDISDIPATIAATMNGQKWSAKANVAFYWSMMAYRAEWRYGIYAHRTALIDAGHVGQSLYIACTGLNIGTCGVAAFAHDLCHDLFKLDGNDEFIVYAAPVGTGDHSNDDNEEKTIYSFVYEEGL